MEDTTDNERIALLNDILRSLQKSGQFDRVPAQATRYYAHIPLGMSGVHYAIAIKSNTVKVGVYFQTRNATLNEQMFIALLKHKGEVEKHVGRPLIWSSEPERLRRFAELEEPANLGARALRDRTSQRLLHLDNICRPILLRIIEEAT